MSLNAGIQDKYVELELAQADLIANSGFELIAPDNGYISEIGLVVQTAVTTGGSIVVKTKSDLSNTVAGLSVTVANGATKGTTYTDTPTAKSSTRKVAKGDRIQIATSGFATAGALRGYLKISAADTDGVMPF